MANVKRGRLLKPGLDYSTIDTGYSHKQKPLQIRKEFGLLGHVMIYEVISWITEGKGWFAEWKDSTADDFVMTRLFDLSLCDKAKEILLRMVEIEFFSPAAFEKHHVLASLELFNRWKCAKKDPEKYMPEGSIPWQIYQTLLDEERNNHGNNDEDEQTDEELIPAEIHENDPKFTETTPKFTENGSKLPKGKKRKVIKQTKKQTNKEAGFFPAEIPQAEEGSGNQDLPVPKEPEPGTGPPGLRDGSAFIAEARHHPHWDDVRRKIAHRIWEVGLSADLTDAITALAIHHEINIPKLAEILKKARKACELYADSRGHAGKEKRWATIRPEIEALFLALGLTLPPCDKHRLEPKPPDELEPPSTPNGRNDQRESRGEDHEPMIGEKISLREAVAEYRRRQKIAV